MIRGRIKAASCRRSAPLADATGLDQSSLVSGLFLAAVFEDRIDRVIGKRTGALMQKVNACLKTAMELPVGDLSGRS